MCREFWQNLLIVTLVPWLSASAVPGAEPLWSLVPPREPEVPKVDSPDWSANPIDRFLLARMKQKGLDPVGLADKRTLIRRATFDLTGLPPTPQEVDAFVNDSSADAWPKVIERLLASPRYGEEWGRHWLDIARYADTSGDSADYPVPQAYLYRDWVIDCFNGDKPYDRFIQEQIAGDLMPFKDEPERRAQIIATGFVALSRGFGVRPEQTPHLTIDDTIDTMGRGILGLTLGCARCHDHKFDPVSSRDYYALYGIFASSTYPYAGCEERQFEARLVPLGQDAIQEAAGQKARLEAAEKNLHELEKRLNEAKDDGARQALEGQIKDATKACDQAIRTNANLDYAFALQDGQPQNARQMLRGDPGHLGDEIPRGFLKVLGGQTLPAGLHGSGRLQLAQWLTSPDNPLTARVMVNRIWQYHFGHGIVRTPSDFGVRGSRPTHPELLDWLAVQFARSGWSVKAMHRLIMLSRAYQLSAESDDHREQLDPANDWQSHFQRRRLEAEQVRDAILLASGELDLSPAGRQPFPDQNDWHYTQHSAFSAVYESNHRSVYLMQQRIRRHPFFATFDGSDTNATTAVRLQTSTPLQALWLMNDPFVKARSEALARRLLHDQPTARGRIDEAFEIILSRHAESEEASNAEQFLAAYQSKLGGPNPGSEAGATAAFVQALFGSNEFMFME